MHLEIELTGKLYNIFRNRVDRETYNIFRNRVDRETF